MGKNFLFVLFTFVSLIDLNSQTIKINSKIDMNSPKGVLIAFLNAINNDKYEESLDLFNKNPVESGDIGFDEFKDYSKSNISNNRSIVSLNFTDIADVTTDIVKITFLINYKDKTSRSKWVNLKKVDGNWKLTITGSLF